MAIMSRKWSPWLLVVVVYLASTVAACSTITTTKLGPSTTIDCTRELPPPLPRIYSGTMHYFQPSPSSTGGSTLTEEEKRSLTQGLILLFPLLVADVPLTLIADTLILPLTIYQQDKYGDHKVICPHIYGPDEQH